MMGKDPPVEAKVFYILYHSKQNQKQAYFWDEDRVFDQRIDPLSQSLVLRDVSALWNVDEDVFLPLEEGYQIVEASPLFHFLILEEMRLNETRWQSDYKHLNGFHLYLNYLNENFFLVKEQLLDVFHDATLMDWADTYIVEAPTPFIHRTIE